MARGSGGAGAHRWAAALCAAAIVAAGCSGGDSGDGQAGSDEPVDLEGDLDVVVEATDTCEALDATHCLLPFPSDFFTVANTRTATGRRVRFSGAVMPENADGTRVDPTEWNRSDGFSPGPKIMTAVPGLDPAASGVPPVTDIAASLERDSAVVLLDTETGERVPLWAELDASVPSDDARILIVRPATSLREGHRHVVALRGLVDEAGAAIPPGDAFRAYRDRLDTGNHALEERRLAMERTFADLDDTGIERGDLWLAWDFTVASEESLSERLLHMRDDAFEALDDGAPDFTVDSVEEAGAARVVRGTYEVPSYLTGDGGPGANLNNGEGNDNPLPERNGTVTANFVCTVPTAATGDEPARWGLFGHGLLGSAEQTVDIGMLAAAVNAGFCGTDWIGMSEGDLEFLAGAIQELTLWRAVSDRLQQAHLNFLVLGRLLGADDGLVTDPAFQDATGAGVVDESQIFFVGGSQGGILGGATSAVATDWERAFLAVPGINYSLLLDRSDQFAPFEPVLADGYPDAVDRTVLLGVIQMLWDRGENNAYAQHLTDDAYDGTRPKKVLLFEAFGDFQVANVSTEVLARTIGAQLREPALAPGRSTAVEPFWGIDPVPELPFDGSALVVWDYGTPAPPVENVAPSVGSDPHGLITSTIPAVLMASDFLRTDGVVTDPCAGQPCRS
ncbi:MAG: hypothetical protein ACRDY6_04695 [Acidimicrobiia bacterium]